MDNAHYGLEIFSKTVNNIVMEGGGGQGMLIHPHPQEKGRGIPFPLSIFCFLCFKFAKKRENYT